MDDGTRNEGGRGGGTTGLQWVGLLFFPLSLAQLPEPTTTPLIADLGGPLVGVGRAQQLPTQARNRSYDDRQLTDTDSQPGVIIFFTAIKVDKCRQIADIDNNNNNIIV
jgi:hypothetical protein